MAMLSWAFSLFLSDVTSMTAVAPAGITAPFEPVTASVVVAVNRSPTLFVFVQTFDVERSVSCVPAAMVPSVPSEPFVPGVTVLPLAVVLGAGVAVDGRGVVVRGVVVRGLVG